MIESRNPATNELIETYTAMSADQVEAILAQGAVAARGWSGVAVAERVDCLRRAATVLDARSAEWAQLIASEMGKSLSEARAEIAKCAWVCRYYAEAGPGFLADEALVSDASESFITYQPLGLVLAVMPWNFPFWQVFRFAAPALTAGNGGILKHAGNVSGCALAIETIFREAGFPEDLFRVLLIETESLAGVIGHEAIQAVTLTGSEGAGSAVAAAAGKALKKVVLELGGSDPYLILEDADLDLAARKCAQSRLINSGQSCIAAKRFLVDRRVASEFLGKLMVEMKKNGNSDSATGEGGIGPLARADLREALHRQVAGSVAAGARLCLGGEIPAGAGHFYPPTILADVRPGMPAFDQELFGPVAAVIVVEDEAEAVQLANRSVYGLGSAVFTRDVERGKAIARGIESGCCSINDFVKSDPRLPFGGIKRSGYGRELSKAGIREFVNMKTICVG